VIEKQGWRYWLLRIRDAREESSLALCANSQTRNKAQTPISRHFSISPLPPVRNRGPAPYTFRIMDMKILALVALLTPGTSFAFALSVDTFQGNPAKKPFDAGGQDPAKTSSTQMLYHSGPVVNLSNSVYVIYHGSFPATTQPVINDFLVGLSGPRSTA
jgi:hypothetical protein